LCAAVPRFAEWRQADVHGIVVVRHGRLAFEHYFAGADSLYGVVSLDTTFDAGTLHDVRSVTKSVTSLCLGIALDHGWVKTVDAPVLSFFPEWSELDTPEDRITLRHLLTMSAGLDWNENIPYTDPANSEIRMIRSSNPYRFALEQPVVAPPGEMYNYSGGSAAIISAVLKKTTGRSIEQFAKDELFDPLGITAIAWYHYSNGDPIAASGLPARADGRLGQLAQSWRGAGGRWSRQLRRWAIAPRSMARGCSLTSSVLALTVRWKSTGKPDIFMCCGGRYRGQRTCVGASLTPHRRRPCRSPGDQP
jgi:CubicO group peptidase (beta-lactamase class C family)